MTLSAMRAPPRAQITSRFERVERQLARFRNELQPRLRALAGHHSRLEDVMISFPALFFALAYPRARCDPAPAIDAVIKGQSLRDVAALAGVPLWLRAFRPMMLRRALPVLPRSVEFGRQILNHVPRKSRKVADWLDSVSLAARLGSDPFAIWYGEVLPSCRNKRISRRLNLLALWAWYSNASGTQAHALIEKPFHVEMTARTALHAANCWKANLELVLCLGNTPDRDMWLDPAIIDGYEFVPLSTSDDVIEEARVMKNCLRTYGAEIAHGSSRFWSVRKDGVRAATLRLSDGYRPSLIEISDIEAAGNKPPPIEAAWAARQWLCAHGPLPARRSSLRRGETPIQRKTWQSLWKPYWLAKRSLPSWLPLAPSSRAFDAL